MASRRPPLANVANGTNSPLRSANLLATKRSQPESASFNEPPLKRQMRDQENNAAFRKPAISTHANPNDAKIFSRRDNSAAPSAFERKLVAVREKDGTAKATKQAKATGDSLESVRQWQRHYRKVFPQFVFYFESVSNDLRDTCARQVRCLGAREEKFFSKAVTHVITSRPIPTDFEAPQAAAGLAHNVPATERSARGPVETVNPTLLDRTAASQRSMHRGVVQDRHEPAASMDILYRAQKMGMKIWTLEKLQRVVSTMNDAEIGPSQGPAARHTTTTATTHGRGRAENDLSLALRNDKIHGYWDRDLFRDMVLFKGPFLYIHDMDEKTRPVMVREYPKTAKRQDGPWPQFRSTRIGKCPFVVDETVKEKELEKKSVSKPKPKEQEPTTQKPLAPPQRPNKELIRQDAEGEPESELSDLEDHLSRTNADTVRPASPRKQGQPPKFAPLDLAQMLKQEWSREPAASGVQPSNITSAIRSQMISSTTGIHGVKATTSKEVNELKRKVLEKNNCTVPLGGTSSSHRQAETAAANRPIRAPVPRAAKTKAQGNLGPIREDAGESNTAGTRKSAKVKRDPKPGYCENCREKFDDFEEHIVTRKHRKFALNPQNWFELDCLLQKLMRPRDYRANTLCHGDA